MGAVRHFYDSLPSSLSVRVCSSSLSASTFFWYLAVHPWLPEDLHHINQRGRHRLKSTILISVTGHYHWFLPQRCNMFQCSVSKLLSTEESREKGLLQKGFDTCTKLKDLVTVARSMVRANHWLRSIETDTFLW